MQVRTHVPAKYILDKNIGKFGLQEHRRMQNESVSIGTETY